jgi:hypothetical protein
MRLRCCEGKCFLVLLILLLLNLFLILVLLLLPLCSYGLAVSWRTGAGAGLV